MNKEFVELTTLFSQDEANLLRSYLEASGIEVHLEGSDRVAMYSIPTAASGIKVKVKEKDLETALELLERHK